MAPPISRGGRAWGGVKSAGRGARSVGKGAYQQVSGRGFQAPNVTTGLGLMPLKGLANMVGMGGVFEALQQATNSAFEKTRALEDQSSRFRAYLTQTTKGIEGGRQNVNAMLQSAVGTGEGGGELTDLLGNEIAKKAGFSSADIGRLGEVVAGSGLRGTGAQFKELAMLSGAIERGFNVSAEAQSQLFKTFGQTGGAGRDTGMTRAQQAEKDVRSILSQTLSNDGAGLMNSDIPQYLQEISGMIGAQARQGISIKTNSILSLGQTFRDSVSESNRKLFQGFAGIGASQGVIDTARGVFGGGAGGIDTALFLSEAQRMNKGASVFDIANLLEKGGEEGEGFKEIFNSVLKRLQGMAPTDESKKALAFSLKQNSSLFGGMGLDQILALLRGRDKSDPKPERIEQISQESAIKRAEEVTGATQKMTARHDREDVSSMQESMATRRRIIDLEHKAMINMRKSVVGLEEASVKMAEGVVKNVDRMSNVMNVFDTSLSGVQGTFNKMGESASILADILADMKDNKKTKRASENTIDRRQRNQRRGGP